MSQAKVDRYKEEKANRKKILAKEKKKTYRRHHLWMVNCITYRRMGRILRL